MYGAAADVASHGLIRMRRSPAALPFNSLDFGSKDDCTRNTTDAGMSTILGVGDGLFLAGLFMRRSASMRHTAVGTTINSQIGRPARYQRLPRIAGQTVVPECPA